MKINLLLKDIKGQGLVEFALVLPLLLLLVFGVVDLSRLAYHKTLLNQAAKESLRVASVGSTLATVTGRLEQLAEPLTGSVTVADTTSTDDEGNSCTQVTLTPSSGYTLTAYITAPYDNSLAVGDTIRICILYNMDFITPLTDIFGSTANLKATYFTRVENPPN